MEDLQNKYENVKFKGMRQEEEIILLLRRHPLILLVNLLVPLLFLGVVIAFHFLGSGLLEYVGLYQSKLFADLIESSLFLFLWLIIFIVWLDYYLDVWVITSERLIDIAQGGLFVRTISELEYSKIQDVTSDVKGLIPTLLNYGTVYVQTAGERARFEFKQIPDPVRVKAIIMELQKQALIEEKKTEGAILRGKL